MKKCPTCDKTYEDSMRFCQIDGATLVDDAPAFDPYATIVSTPSNPISLAPEPVAEPEPVVEAAVIDEPEAVEEPAVNQTVSSFPIAPPSDILDLPEPDPLKTMFASDTEMKDILSPAAAEEPLMEVPEVAEPPAPSFIAPEPPTPEPPAPSFGDMTPPPSPFSTPNAAGEEAVPQPAFETPAPSPAYEEPTPEPDYDEPATMIQPSVDIPFDPPQPVAQWTPPPVPDANWQNQEIGSNTPFQPPPAGVAGENKTLGLVSLILGILSFFCLGFLGSIPAIILGFMQKSRIKKDPGQYTGGGLATAGIVLGFLNVVFTIVVLIIYAGVIIANLR